MQKLIFSGLLESNAPELPKQPQSFTLCINCFASKYLYIFNSRKLKGSPKIKSILIKSYENSVINIIK